MPNIECSSALNFARSELFQRVRRAKQGPRAWARCISHIPSTLEVAFFKESKMCSLVFLFRIKTDGGFFFFFKVFPKGVGFIA